MDGDADGPVHPGEGWLTTAEVMSELGMSRTWVWRLVQEGDLECRRGSRDRWEISRASLDRYIEECRMTPQMTRSRVEQAGDSGHQRGPADPSPSG